MARAPARRRTKAATRRVARRLPPRGQAVLRKGRDLYRRSPMRLGRDLYWRATGHLHMAPDYLIIGAQRSGTTSLYTYLRRNRHIGKARKKEVHFFDFNYERGMGWYKHHFPTLRTKRAMESRLDGPFITGEASPYYLVNPAVPARVQAALPSVKLIVLLRDPINRAYSHFHQQRRLGNETAPTFEEAIERERAVLERESPASLAYRKASYLVRGIYVDQLERWHAFFPREQLLVLRSEDFFADPGSVEREACEFLGVPPRPRAKYPRRTKKRYPAMDTKTREFLVAYYREHNHRLYEYLGRDLGWS